MANTVAVYSTPSLHCTQHASPTIGSGGVTITFFGTGYTVVVNEMNHIVARPYGRKTSDGVHSIKHHRVF